MMSVLTAQLGYGEGREASSEVTRQGSAHGDISTIASAVNGRRSVTTTLIISTQSVCTPTSLQYLHCLVGLVVKASASRADDPGFKSRLRRDLSWSSLASDLKIGTPVATLLGAWRYMISTGTGWPGVSIPSLGDWIESLICNFYLSVAARQIV